MDKRLACCALAVMAFAISPHLAAQSDTVSPATVVMTGLESPRGLAFGPDGALYVAEAGTGPVRDPQEPLNHPCFADPTQVGCSCGIAGVGNGALAWSGPTGAVSRLRQGLQERVVEGLPSWSFRGGLAEGPNGVSMVGLGEAFVTIGLQASPRNVDYLRDRLGSGFGRLVQFDGLSGVWRFVADFVAYEKEFNPQPRVIDSNPFGLLATPGAVVVADAGGDDLLLVVPNGDISTLAVLPRVAQTTGSGPVLTDAVPTSIAVGPDGAIYVGELTGAPANDGASTIYRLDPGGALVPYLTGFRTVMGVAFDQLGDLYVLQYFMGDPTQPNTGVLIRVAPDGVRTTVLAGLDHPTGVAVGPDGAVYISNHGVTPGQFGQGEILRIMP